MNRKNKIQTVYVDNIGKLPPNSIDVEQILIGQILIDYSGCKDVFNILRHEMFYNENNKIIFEAIEQLHNIDFGVNLMTVIDKIRKNGKLDTIGGAYTITSLSQNVSTSLSYKYHAHIIHQNWIKREFINFGHNLSLLGYNDLIDIEDITTELKEFNKTIDYEVKAKTNDFYKDTILHIDDYIEANNFFLRLRQNNIEYNLFSNNSLSIIFGGAKSRKSTLLSLFTAVISSGIDIGYLYSEKRKVKIFDTEQSPYYAQKILHRIHAISNDISNVTLHCLQKYNCELKKLIIEQAIIKDKPEVVIIDNIRDLLYDILDFKESSKLSEWLKYLMGKYNVHICVVIHRNKGDENARGHIGTELKNFCECQIQTEKNKEDNKVSDIKFVELRDKFTPNNEILEVDINGIPSFLRGTSVNDFIFKDKNKERPF